MHLGKQLCFWFLSICWGGSLLGTSFETQLTKANGEEPLCIYSLAYRLLQRTGFKMIELESTVYIRRIVGGLSNYILYASQVGGAEPSYRITVDAVYSNAQAGMCLARAVRFVDSEENDIFFMQAEARVTSDSLPGIVSVKLKGQIIVDPTNLPKGKAVVSEDFEVAREWGKLDVLAPDTKIAEVGKEQAATAGGELAALTARRYLWIKKPTASTLSKSARTVTGGLLWADLTARGYYALVRQTDPGEVAIWTGVKGITRPIRNVTLFAKEQKKISEVGIKRVKKDIDSEEQTARLAEKERMERELEEARRAVKNRVAPFMTPNGEPRADVKKIKVNDSVLFEVEQLLYWKTVDRIDQVSQASRHQSKGWFIETSAGVFEVGVRPFSWRLVATHIGLQDGLYERQLNVGAELPQTLGKEWEPFKIGTLNLIWSKSTGSLLSLECIGLPHELKISLLPLNRKLIENVEPIESRSWIVDLKLTYRDKSTQTLTELVKETLKNTQE